MNILKDTLPTVVIFGRSNVGKSTLFNCLREKKQALTADIEGTTRDANWGEIEWQGIKFNLVDTGGIIKEKFLSNKGRKAADDDIDAQVQVRIKQLVEQAAAVVFLLDARAGLLPGDKSLALFLKRTLAGKTPIITAANKADNPRLRRGLADFARLGLGEIMPVSAANGSGSGDLLDKIVDCLPTSGPSEPPTEKQEDGQPPACRLAIIGKPNVGKSSLINALAGEERVIVSPVPHTTREPQDILLQYQGQAFTFIDTAGLSRQGQKGARQKSRRFSLEKLSIQKSLAALGRADIALLVLDISTDLSRQEAKLAEEALKRQVSLIIVANKWDLITLRDQKHYKATIYSQLPFITWAPIHFISALTGSKVDKLYDLIVQAKAGRETTISANTLSKLLNRLVKAHTPTKSKGTKRPHIYELKQADTAPPVFSVRIGAKENISDSYLNYISNRLREKFGFYAAPIKIYVEKNVRIHGKHQGPQTSQKKQ